MVSIGVYSINSAGFDVFLVMGFGLLGYGMTKLEFPPAPMILAFILSPLLEENFRRALLISRGEFSVFATKPILATFLALSAGIIAFTVISPMIRRHRQKTENRSHAA